MSEKMRVHILAKELNVPSKTIIEKCKAEGLDNVKNHMSTLSAGLYATIKEWFSEGEHDTAVETTARVDLKTIRPRRAKQAESTLSSDESSTAVIDKESDAQEATPPATPQKAAAIVDAPAAAEVAASPTEPEAPVEQPEPAPQEVVAEAPAPETVETPETTEPVAEAQTTAAPADADQPTAVEVDQPEVIEALGSELVEELVGEGSDAESTAPPAESVEGEPETSDEEPEYSKDEEDDGTEEPSQVAGPQNVPQPYKLKGPRVVRYEAPEPEIQRRRPPSRRPQRPAAQAPGQMPPSAPMAPSGPGGGRGSGGTGKGSQRGKSRVNPRRSSTRLNEAGERMAEWRDQDLAERQQRLAGATGKRIHRRRSNQPAQQSVDQGPKTNAKVHEPIRMKEFCSATGLNFMQCFKVLRDQLNMLANINMNLPTEAAEMLALEFGIELEVIPAKTLLDLLQEEHAAIERKKLKLRPPVVTMLGHVDHGKTSLLDAIRRTRVAASEDGGITQHIGAYHLETAHGTVTFLDTPGHEAFTAMRARGAQLTDIVVLVVAADDGVMPQTIEAINHAKDAGVAIVVALNKIDLGDQNLMKIYGQLAEHGLTPSGDWGGETDVIPTAAPSGEGIGELVEHLAALAELLDLKADATIPAAGTVVEAETKMGVGAVARVLVQEGTLKVGDIVVCGNAAGKVRVLVDDQGQRLTEATPSTPVEVWGLDDVPNSGDKLFVVETLQRAKSIASEVKQHRLQSSRISSRKVTTLEQMFKKRAGDEIPELNIIVKADVDGSVQMLEQTLAKIPTDEVKLAVRHSGVGAVNDSDVLLAAACDGLVIAYRVEAPIGVRRLADQEGVEVRNYRVVYDVHDDIKKALEGLLEPDKHVESRGSATVKNVFRISKLGIVAGCLVTDGFFLRTHLAKIVRDGVVVRENCKISSLRRFKDDVKEVRSGIECGIRVEDFDDVHEGDVIESYEIVEVARTL